MITTIRIDKELQRQLKLKSAETGKTQLELANQYILDGLKKDNYSETPAMSLDEIEKLLKHDKKNQKRKTRYEPKNYEIPEMLKLKDDEESKLSANYLS